MQSGGGALCAAINAPAAVTSPRMIGGDIMNVLREKMFVCALTGYDPSWVKAVGVLGTFQSSDIDSDDIEDVLVEIWQYMGASS